MTMNCKWCMIGCWWGSGEAKGHATMYMCSCPGKCIYYDMMISATTASNLIILTKMLAKIL